jgi:hypothetical protein
LSSIDPTSSKANQTSPVHLISTEPGARLAKSRKKPGKKRRIVLRRRAKAIATAKETDAEKRNRRNREKKIKRRQKKREQKAVPAAVAGKQSTELMIQEGAG